ncbi:MAG TPA: hypothetical protein VMV07_04900 [Streptosporangiaceae bacterium]|nr:hypothetical protein [Streptosporangiaceae bacterium]
MVRHALTVAGAAALTLLTVACGSLGLSSAGDELGGSALPAAYGSGVYRLRGHTGGYTAEVIVKQAKGGIAVVAVKGAFHRRRQLCAPGLTFALNENDSGRLKWTMPPQPGCAKNYISSEYLVCLSSSRIPAGAMPKGDSIAGCDHPVLPVSTGINASLTARNQSTGIRYLVSSIGIVLRTAGKAGRGK